MVPDEEKLKFSLLSNVDLKVNVFSVTFLKISLIFLEA